MLEQENTEMFQEKESLTNVWKCHPLCGDIIFTSIVKFFTLAEKHNLNSNTHKYSFFLFSFSFRLLLIFVLNEKSRILKRLKILLESFQPSLMMIFQYIEVINMFRFFSFIFLYGI